MVVNILITFLNLEPIFGDTESHRNLLKYLYIYDLRRKYTMKRIFMIYLIFIMILSSSPITAVSAVYPGTIVESINESTIWTKEGSPYKVAQSIGLPEGVTLTIEKGVTVEFARDAGISAIFGQLIINGTEAEKVIFQFTPNLNSLQLYNERVFLGSNSKLKHVDIQGARIGLEIYGQQNIVENARLTDNDFYGIYVTGKNNVIVNSQLNNNLNGISLFGGENVLIGNTVNSSAEKGVIVQENSTKNIFINNTVSRSGTYGLHSEAPYDSIVNRFYHNTFKENQLGILTGTANVFQHNNFYDVFNVLRSTLWNMDVSNNYWGTDNKEEINRKISIPETYYQLKFEPYLTVMTGQTEQIEPRLPVLNPVKDNSEFITGMAHPGDTVTVTQRYSYWTSIKEAVADDSGKFSVRFSQVPSGEKIEVFSTNQFGLKSPIVNTYVLDGTKPNPPVLEEISNRSGLIKGTGEAGAKVTVKKGEQLLGEATVNQDGSFEVLIPIQTEGTVLTVFLTDSSQLTSDPISITVKDQIAPSSPTINPVTTRSTSLTGSSEAGATVYLYTDSRVLLQQTIVGSDGSWSFEIGKQPIGTIYKLDAVDKSGNRSTESLVKVQLPMPEIDEFTDSMTILKGNTEPAALIWISVDGGYHGSVTADSTGQFQYDLGQQKPDSVIKVQVFKNGYTAVAETVVVDVTAPAAPDAVKVTEHSDKVMGVAERNAKITIKANGIEIANGIVNNVQEFYIDIPKQKAGTILEIQAMDGKGNLSEITTLVVENVPPTVPSVQTPTNKSSQLIGKADPNVTIIAVIAGVKYIAKAGSDGTFKINIPIQNTGTSITVTAKESASSVSDPVVIKVLRAGPNMPTINPINNKSTYIAGRTEPYAIVSVIVNGRTYSNKADAKGIFKITIPVQNLGTRVLIVAKDQQIMNSATRVTTVIRVAPNMPTVNPIRTSTTLVTGKTEAYVMVSVKIGVKSYTAKSDKYGNFKVTIPKQRKGTKSTIYAKDAKGQLSAARTITVY
jgi:hypothetical protein